MIPFLQADWTDLIIASYAVPDEWLTAYLPAGVEIDRFDGRAYVSLVAFDFLRARVLGVSTPVPRSLCNFPEVNLRFYARYEGRAGVVFIKELVPNPIVAWTANAAYNESYAVARMSSRVTQVGEARRARHDFVAEGKRHAIAVTGRGAPQTAASDATATFFKERAWGFGKGRSGRTNAYAVHHPVWRTYATEDPYIDVDFGLLYGPPWDSLNSREPDSLILAEGSGVTVYSWTAT